MTRMNEIDAALVERDDREQIGGPVPPRRGGGLAREREVQRHVVAGQQRARIARGQREAHDGSAREQPFLLVDRRVVAPEQQGRADRDEREPPARDRAHDRLPPARASTNPIASRTAAVPISATPLAISVEFIEK